MKSTNHLTNEHKLILRALDVLDALCGSIEKSGSVNAVDVSKILDFLRWFADAHHQSKEETILFPALKRAAASQGRPVEHMTWEHSQERSSVEGLEKDVRLADVSEFVSAANRLSSTLRNHIYKEDRILFEAADAVLTPKEDEAVFEQLTRFDTALDKQLLEEKLKDLRSLEWEYLRK
jgi:hemerythrin-like domain-containing protein